MPVEYLRTLTAPERTRRTDVHLGLFLAFNAGAINAGGFLAVSQYTSHMTGLVPRWLTIWPWGTWTWSRAR